MASLLKSKKSSSSGKFVFPLVVIGLIIGGFLLLPEIMSFFQSFTGKQEGEEQLASESSEIQESQDYSIDYLLNQPLKSNLAEGKVMNVSLSIDEPEQGCSVKDSKEKEEVEEEKVVPLIPLEGPLTWEDLQKPEILKVLDEADKKARALFTKVDPTRYLRSRFLLSNFIAALGTVRAGKKNGLMSPEEALQKLDYSDSEVTNSFSEEQIEREQQVAWAEISIAPLIRDPLSARIKSRLVAPYDPRMTLTEVQVAHERVKEDRLYRSAPVTITLRGYVIGQDTDRVEWFLGDRQWEARRIGLNQPDLLGRRYFEIRDVRQGQEKLVSLRAISKDGIAFDKRYNFFPLVAKKFRPKKQDNGNFLYQIPYKPFDPRLDRTFLLQQVRFNPSMIKPSPSEELLDEESPMVAF